MSRWTTSSLNLRPIKRLIANKVFLGLVTAWRFADWPTNTSSSLVKATMDGVVRSPSLFSIMRGLPSSNTETQELVVPKSIPIILPIIYLHHSYICCWLHQPLFNYVGGMKNNFKPQVPHS